MVATQKMMVGAGCFWGVEDIFMQLEGVVKTQVGFAGGKVKNPSYEQVCAHGTGHVEVCLLEFNPQKVSYQKLLDTFWAIHDPTQGNRQGPDVGDQYRSVIYYFSEEQKKLAEESKKKLEASKKYKKPITTTIEPASPFYRAEEYHQKYFMKTGQSNCHVLPSTNK